ncbi:NAD(P)-dependent oxidoreductase [Arthrobacter sp. ISL-65]|uniref:NAD-dependent epimerase/dehydratase family protein n=1 Tax=Arthrobacter sp. ISL-65 TaxID=2819112 RepID=UPI001BE59E45|nr:NAD(P)-dependent oxidoreductase [Arthrobacter sp. ISL-65]MBT2546853.1 NAD(P)-dependent oxidoreductase [Arthrobacter sp. ISL-65]
MKVVITGAHGKVGRAATQALLDAGHNVLAVDLTRPGFDRPEEGTASYQQADLTDAGQAYAVVRHADAVVHAAAIPEPTGNPAQVVFQTNLMATFNILEASIRFGVKRFVNISSETVPGFFFPERDFLPDYAPVDEEHPIRPQDPYALSKHFSEQLMDAAVRRSDIRCISLRPSWVQNESNYEQNLGPQVRDASVLSPNLWSYVDAYDLADSIVLATESELPGHEVFYIASPDNVGGRNFGEILKTYYGDKIELRSTARPDASGISSAKAQRMLGWTPKRSWRDYLDVDGKALPHA